MKYEVHYGDDRVFIVEADQFTNWASGFLFLRGVGGDPIPVSWFPAGFVAYIVEGTKPEPWRSNEV